MKYTLIILLSLILFACTDKSTKRSVVKTPNAPQAIGPYSQAIKSGNTLYISGQIAIDPSTSKMVNSDIVSETDRVMENIGAILHKENMSYRDIVSTSVYLKSLDDYAVFNRIYAKYFVADPPARSTVEVSKLPKGALVEITVIAVR